MFSVLRISIGSLYSIFNLYYVTLFLDVYRLDQWWFYVGQIVYFIWNSINDPIFGWLQDRMTSAAGGRNPRHTSITIAAPAYLIAFIYPFVPLFIQDGPNRNWTLGMHFIISLCFFDGMFTWIGLAHCAWFSDISSSTQKRARVTLLVSFRVSMDFRFFATFIALF
jgi:Na+/melibiose symporter-like transporter